MELKENVDHVVTRGRLVLLVRQVQMEALVISEKLENKETKDLRDLQVLM